MAEFRTQTVEQLAHELTLAPARHRARHIDGAARAIELMRPDHEYPRSFLVFQITGYRSRQADDLELSGRDLIPDLVRLIEKLSLLTPQTHPGDAAQLADAAALCQHWQVSAKTLERWRALGLVARWYDTSEGPALLFALPDIERFETTHAVRIRRAASYRRVDDGERQQLVQRTLDVMSAKGCGLVVATQVVAGETGRAAETIRVAVRNAQKLHAAEPVSQSANFDDAEMVFAAHRAGQSVNELARRFRSNQKEVRSRLTRGRAAELMQSQVKYIFAPEFDHPDAARLIFADTPSTEEPAAPDRVPAGLPPYLRDLCAAALLTRSEERDLFRRCNYLLHRAEMARRLLDLDTATDAAMDHVETLLAQALTIKNRIIHANQRLVISIARRHLGRVPGLDLPELISEGNIALMRAAEGFDFSRGHRFSTYATWSVSRAFGHSVALARGHCEHFQTGHDEPWEAVASSESPDPSRQVVDVETSSALRDVLADLDPREREILERRFGLNASDPQTLAEVSTSLHVSRERVRQIEAKSLIKLRTALERRGLATALA